LRIAPILNRTEASPWDTNIREQHGDAEHASAVPESRATALERMGKVTGAFEVVFSDDVEMFRPAALSRFDAICFNNSLGVLFDDPALRASLSRRITGSVSWAICIRGTLAVTDREQPLITSGHHVRDCRARLAVVKALRCASTRFRGLRP